MSRREREGFEKAAELTADISKHSRQISRRVSSASNELLAIMSAIDIDTLSRAEQRKIIRRVNEILAELDAALAQGVTKGINDVYEQGRARTLVALGEYSTIGAARRYLRSDKATMSRAHRNIRLADIETTMEDLLAMTQNTRRRVKAEIRQVAADIFRTDENLRSQRRQLTRRLQDAGVFAIRDRANRRWKIDHYADVVVTTKLSQAHREATEQEAREQGAGYVVVSRHSNPCSKCEPWEGRLLRLSADVEGDIPTLDEAMADGLFHPNCEHTTTVVRNPDVLPDWVRR